MKQRGVRVLTVLGLLSFTMAALCLSPLPAGAAAAGTANITRPGSLTVLNSGGSETPYGVLLPSGASCPGDTAHDGYHVFSYLVPSDVSPVVVSFKTGVPSRYYGFISAGTYIGAVNTALNTGEIVGLPSQFSFSRWTRQELIPAGANKATWNGGIACANIHGVVTSYWGASITFRADASDPGGYSWSVDQSPPGTFHPLTWIGPILIVLAAAFGAWAIVMRRRHFRGDRSPRRSDEGRPLDGDQMATGPARVPEAAQETSVPEPARGG